MARYDEPESQGVGSAEFHGLSGADLLGLSASSQAAMASWRLQYSPQMWLGATTGAFKWPGTFLIGGGIPKSFLQGVAKNVPWAPGQKGLNIVGNVLGGWERDFVDPVTQDLMKRGRYNVFSRGGSRAFAGGYQRAKFTEAIGKAGWERDGMAWFKWRKGTPSNVAYTGQAWDYLDAAGKGAIKQSVRGGAANQLWRLRALKIMGGANVILTTALLADLAANVAYGGIVATNALAQRLSTSNLLDMTSGANIVGAYGASTERQRALQAIQANNLNARRFIGSEGAMMHQ